MMKLFLLAILMICFASAQDVQHMVMQTTGPRPTPGNCPMRGIWCYQSNLHWCNIGGGQPSLQTRCPNVQNPAFQTAEMSRNLVFKVSEFPNGRKMPCVCHKGRLQHAHLPEPPTVLPAPFFTS